MDKEFREFEVAIRESVKVPEMDVQYYKDASTMSHVVSAELDSRIVSAVSDKVISRLGRTVGLGFSEFLEFLQFLGRDPEIRDKFTAYKTAKRLMGE